MWRILVLSVLSFATVACQARIDTHGFMPDRTLIDQIEAGKQNRQTVAQILGSPSTISTFDANIWYYITQQTKNYAFFKPEIIDQTVLVVAFDDGGTVAEVRQYTIEDGLIVDPVTRKTPTVGKELTILQQLFGNVGRFSRDAPRDTGPGAPLN